VVTPQTAEGEQLEDVVQRLESWLQQRQEVDLVQVDFKWLQRLAGLLELGDALVTVLTVLFSLAAVVVVSNTIRMDVASRAEEIQVLSLVGAGNGFIRQPLARLLDAYGNQFEVLNLGASGFLLVLLSGGLLGFIGALISVQRYLIQISAGGIFCRI
jgi:cell division transport system permease protein